MDRKQVAQAEEPLRESDHFDARPRLPTVAPQHPKQGHMWLNVEAGVVQVYMGDEWVQIPLLSEGL